MHVGDEVVQEFIDDVCEALGWELKDLTQEQLNKVYEIVQRYFGQ